MNKKKTYVQPYVDFYLIEEEELMDVSATLPDGGWDNTEGEVIGSNSAKASLFEGDFEYKTDLER